MKYLKYYSVTLLSSIGVMTICTPAHSQEIKIDLGSVINGILSPPHWTAEINARADVEKERLRQQAEIEKAKIAADATKNTDRVAPILTQWGVNRVNCAPGVAFINGLSADTVCINPTSIIQAGYYNYSPDRQLLVYIGGNNAPTYTPTVNPPTATTTVTKGGLPTIVAPQPPQVIPSAAPNPPNFALTIPDVTPIPFNRGCEALAPSK